VIHVRASATARFPGLHLAKGFRGLHPFFAAHPEEALPYRSLVAAAKSFSWPAAIAPTTESTYDHPAERDAGWTHHLEGVAAGADSWYFANEGEIWKAPFGEDLDGYDAESGAAIPPTLKAAGYNHYGDADFRKGRLFVPLEHPTYPPPKLVVFDAELGCIGWADLAGQAREAPWCAIQPGTELLFTSSFNMSAEDALHVYRVGVAPGASAPVTAEHLGQFRLLNEVGEPIVANRIQGGCFTDQGHLYLVWDDGGLLGFDMLTGRLVRRVSVDYAPGGGIKGRGSVGDQELQGIAFKPTSLATTPGIAGQLHLCMIEVEITGAQLYFKHYEAQASAEAWMV
jgi:hypothetical protein